MPDTAEIDWIDNGDGSFTDPNSGQIVDWDYNVIGYDPNVSVAWIDNGDGTFTNPQTGAIVDWDYNVIGGDGLIPRGGDGSGTDYTSAPIDLHPSQGGGGFLQNVGNFLSNLFGGGTFSVSAGPGGAGPGAPGGGGGQTMNYPGTQARPMDPTQKTILIAAGVGLGVYALTRRRGD